MITHDPITPTTWAGETHFGQITGTSARNLVKSGKDDIETGRRILRQSVFAIESSEDFSNGAPQTPYLHLQDLTPNLGNGHLFGRCPMWSRIPVSAVLLRHHDSRAYVPFPENTFDLIYAGSVLIPT
jgi:hypothetical protein